MSITHAEAIRRFFDDPDAGSFKPSISEMKELVKDKPAFHELGRLSAEAIGETVASVEAPAS
jgi:hypothetical protein